MTQRAALDQRDGGFTLLETLVAIVIFAAAILLFERTVAGSWRGITAANARTQAASLALQKLDEAGAIGQLNGDGETEGQAGRFTWRISVAQAPDPSATDDAASITNVRRVIPYWVDVSVSWRDGVRPTPNTVHYRVLKLAPSQ